EGGWGRTLGVLRDARMGGGTKGFGADLVTGCVLISGCRNCGKGIENAINNERTAAAGIQIQPWNAEAGGAAGARSPAIRKKLSRHSEQVARWVSTDFRSRRSSRFSARAES